MASFTLDSVSRAPDDSTKHSPTDGGALARPPGAPPLDANWYADLPHQPFYCEENATFAATLNPEALAIHRRRVIVLRGRGAHVAVWAQAAGREAGLDQENQHNEDDEDDASLDPSLRGVILWDYHVVAMHQADDGAWWVVDADCLEGPCLPLITWLIASFRDGVAEPCQPLFCVFTVDDWQKRFASDRRHMRDSDGAWHRPPPPWPPIGVGHTLDELLRLDDDSNHFVDLMAFVRRHVPLEFPDVESP